ncbi:transmembrane amino acid transporter protein-domain-containing protein [Aspergillus granulosus]|uniref:Transmembrane amino acid transporter protein-domain-containing protein n=1 Tax=Aspergillus granulosus TaxID=176169 RepID=A0ABR4GYE4_9EURO
MPIQSHAHTYFPSHDAVDEIGHDAAESKDQKHDPARTAENPFGNEEHAEVKYRVMRWWYVCLMIAQNISLGILSLPSAVATLGLVPAIILLLILSGISWYTGYVIYQFKLRHPHIHSMGDAGEMLMGRFGRELLGIGQVLLMVFIMASHILTFMVLMNVLTEHGTCTIVFGVVGLVLSFLGALPRTMDRVYWISIASFISILTATFTTIIAIGVQNPIAELDILTKVSLEDGFLAVTNIIFAYIAHAAFFGWISEMENPREFPKSLALLQVVDTSMYMVTAIVIYIYAGRDVASPALSSAGPLMKKVAYGLAIPTVLFSGVIVGHVACKYIYVRVFRGSAHMHNNGLISIGAWVSIALVLWIIAWLIAESIPVFNNLLALISSLFGSWFSYGLPAMFWLSMNRGRWFSSRAKICLAVVNVAIFVVACVICVLGLYVSIRSIHEASGTVTWTCANTT